MNPPVGEYRNVLITEGGCSGCERKFESLKDELDEVNADGERRDRRIENLEAELSRLKDAIKKVASTRAIKETCSRYKLSVREFIRQVHHYVINSFLVTDEGQSFQNSLPLIIKKELEEIHLIRKFLLFLYGNSSRVEFERYMSIIYSIREPIMFSDAVETLFIEYDKKIANHSAYEDAEPFEDVCLRFNDVLTQAGETESKKELAMKTLLALQNLNEFVKFKNIHK